MQAVILAAGLGRRLGKLTQRSTKCMVELNGRRLIDYTMEAVAAAGVSRVVLVIGHGGDEVQRFVGSEWRGIPVSYVSNELYQTTNNIYSLQLAADELCRDDSLIIESDVVFEPSILTECVLNPAANVAVVAPYQPWMDGTVTLLDGDGRISRFISSDEVESSASERYYKTVNIYKLSRQFLTERFLPFLEMYVNMDGRGGFYEEVLRVLAFMGGDTLTAQSVGSQRWYEIDDPNDLDIATSVFAPPGRRFDDLSARYGGFWRFPEVRDFAYLVNPFFPPAPLLAELVRGAPSLISQYPSGQRVQRLLAARLVKCSPEQVVVGNGASELLAALMAVLKPASMALQVPTFEEYRRLAPAQIFELEWPGCDLNSMLRFCTEHHPAAVVLVNPGNPTGDFQPRSSVLALASALRDTDSWLIVDESFIDFVDGTNDHSVLVAETLDEHRNVVIVKSISKSYGVPGLRLGVLASGNRALIEQLANGLPIWNINSLAEYFLQAVGRFERQYFHGCQQVARERERFIARLRTVPCIDPYPSHANFVLCDVVRPFRAADLAEALLHQYSILIKDCSGKRGLEGRQCIRLAVKSADDDDYLLDCLRQLIGGGIESDLWSKSLG
jgi:histidinol-phosphate/aromatic aminotransferase/cobyric acid decarboxylase-like protein/choline kinase